MYSGSFGASIVKFCVPADLMVGYTPRPAACGNQRLVRMAEPASKQRKGIKAA
jgi:hypothetical protein